jgi:type VI protein secretion system component Hcp
MAIMYLKLDGITGDVTQKGREGQFLLESFSWGESRDQPAANVVGELACVAPVGRASPTIAQACARATPIASATITIWVPSASGAEIQQTTVVADNTSVSSYQMGGSKADPQVFDRFTLTFQKLTIADLPHGNVGVIEPAPPA